jgi:hypothetical protein
MSVSPETYLFSLIGRTSGLMRFCLKFLDQYTIRIISNYGYLDINSGSVLLGGQNKLRFFICFSDFWAASEHGLIYNGLMNPYTGTTAVEYQYDAVIGAYTVLSTNGFNGKVNYFMIQDGFNPSSSTFMLEYNLLDPAHCNPDSNCKIALNSSSCFGKNSFQSINRSLQSNLRS